MDNLLIFHSLSTGRFPHPFLPHRHRGISELGRDMHCGVVLVGAAVEGSAIILFLLLVSEYF